MARLRERATCRHRRTPWGSYAATGWAKWSPERAAARRLRCHDCQAAIRREQGRRAWQRIKIGPQQLAARRAAGCAYARRKAEQERARRPPKPPGRRLPDGRLRCLGCDQAKAEGKFYWRKIGYVEARCKACHQAAARARSAARRAG